MTHDNDLDTSSANTPTEQQNERNWAALLNDRGIIKVRCPECYKLYNVRSADIRESRPKFKCTSCAQRFWLAYPEALEQPDGVIGFPTEWIENSQEKNPTAKTTQSSAPLNSKPYACPKCTEAYGEGQSECTKCGLIFAKFQEREKMTHIRHASKSEDAHPTFAQEPEIKDAWENVIQNFESLSTHQNFIHLCQKMSALDYAVAKYSELSEICPHDENVKSSLRQCLAIQTVRTEIVRHPVKSKTKQNLATQTWQSFVGLVQSAPVDANVLKKVFKIRASTFLLMVAVGLIVVGFLTPPMRNLVGIGCSLGFLAMALKYFRAF